VTLAVRAARPLVGHAKPRIAPPTPARSDLAGFRTVAREIGISLMPWQATAARHLEARASDGRHLYQEVCVVVARQNGKTEELVPLIVKRLRAGRRIMHTAQNRELPREVFARVADIMSGDEAAFRQRSGRIIRPRFANGQEEIRLSNGGRYRIVAPTRGGARGGTNDDVIIDELREMSTFEFIGAAKPTLTASPDPQILYLSNAGDESSVVLDSVRKRAGKDPRLAYLEWSAAPERAADDVIGWAEANPALGHFPTMQEYLEGEYLTNRLAGTLAIFETEHLCRWVPTTRESLVDAQRWTRCEAADLEQPARPYMAVSMDPSGKRASAAIAWRQADDTFALRMLFDVPGDPIDTDRLGRDLREVARQLRAVAVGFDPMTDAALARWFPKTEPITGAKYANASSRFVALVDKGGLRWNDCAAVTEDLTWTARKAHDESGSFQAVRGNDDRPITATLAAIRAVWLASEPKASKPYVRQPLRSAGF
jgi:phage terminase large subunit-like protein